MKKIRKLLLVLNIGGWRRIFPILKSFIPYLRRINNYRLYQAHFIGKTGLEIGGPSKIFKRGSILPIYPIVKSLDGCNYAGETIWEGRIDQGATYYFDRSKAKGDQYIREATDLSGISSGKYEYVISAHCLEHIANPLKALKEWLRVLKQGGILLLVLPDKNMTFDRKRGTTSFEHLLNDYKDDIGENDTTHVDEVIASHDLRLDHQLGGRRELVERLGKNVLTRSMHHHVFDRGLLMQIFKYLNLKVLSVDFAEPEHIIILGQKL